MGWSDPQGADRVSDQPLLVLMAQPHVTVDGDHPRKATGSHPSLQSPVDVRFQRASIAKDSSSIRYAVEVRPTDAKHVREAEACIAEHLGAVEKAHAKGRLLEYLGENPTPR
jgi:hypothetical protein